MAVILYIPSGVGLKKSGEEASCRRSELGLFHLVVKSIGKDKLSEVRIYSESELGLD